MVSSNVLGDLVVRINGDITGLIAAFAGAKAGMAGLGAGVAAWNAIGVGLTAALTVPIMGVGAVAFESALQVQKGYSIIIGQTGAVGVELDKLKADFGQVFANVPQSAEQVATVISIVQDRLRGMGIDVAETSRLMLDLARVSGESATGLADAVSKMFKQWPEAAADVSGTIETLNETFEATHVPVAQLATDVDKFGTVWREAGFNLQETMAIMAQLDAAGLNSTDVVRGMAYAWSNLQKGSVATKGALAEAYTEISNKTKQMGLDTSKSSDMMQAFFKGIEDGTIKDSTAIQLFGSRFGANITGAIHEGRISSDEFIKSLAEMPDHLERGAQAALTFSQRISIMRHRLELAFAPLGFTIMDIIEGFLPTIESIIGAAGRLATTFSALPQSAKLTVLAFAGFLAALGPIALITNQISIAFRTMSGFIAGINLALSGTAAAAAAAGTATGLMQADLTVAAFEAAAVDTEMNVLMGTTGMAALNAAAFGEALAADEGPALGLQFAMNSINASLGVATTQTGVLAGAISGVTGEGAVLETEMGGFNLGLATADELAAGLAGTFGSVVLATDGEIIGITGMNVELAAANTEMGIFDALWAANPIGIIVLAVAGLAVLLYALYTNFKPFHDAVQEVVGWIADVVLHLNQVQDKKVTITEVHDVKNVGQVAVVDGQPGPPIKPGVSVKPGEQARVLGPNERLDADGHIVQVNPETGKQEGGGPPDVGGWVQGLGPWGQRLKERAQGLNNPPGELVETTDATSGAKQIERTNPAYANAGGLNVGEGPFASLVQADIPGKIGEAIVTPIGKAFDDVKKRASEVPEAIKKAFQEAFTNITTTLNTWKNALGHVWDTFLDGCNTVKNTVGGIWDGLVKAAQPVITGITTIADTIKRVFTIIGVMILAVLLRIAITITTWAATVATALTNAWNTLVKTAQNIWNGLVAFFGPILDNIKNIIINGWNGIVSFLTGVYTTIQTDLTNAWNTFVGIVGPPLDNIKNTIMNGWNSIVSFLTGIWNTITSGLTTAWNGLVNIVTSVGGQIVTAATNLWNTIVTGATDLGGKIWSAITGGLNTLKNNIGAIWDGIVTAASTAWSGLVEAIKTAAGNVMGALRSWLRDQIPGGSLGDQMRSWFDGAWPAAAEGGLFTQATTVTVGEAGPELIVPLDKIKGGAEAANRMPGAFPLGTSGTRGASQSAPTYITNVTVDSENIVRKVFQAIQQLEDYHHLAGI